MNKFMALISKRRMQQLLRRLRIEFYLPSLPTSPGTQYLLKGMIDMIDMMGRLLDCLLGYLMYLGGEMTCYIQRRPAIFRDGKLAIPNCGVVFS